MTESRGEYVADLSSIFPYGSQLERIVHCRDCKYYTDHEWVIITDVSDVCHFWGDGPVKVEPDGFCKWGERREDA